MEKVGYAILLVASVAWLVAIVIEMIPLFPYGTIGLIVLVGVGFLFAKVLKERLEAAKGDRYSRDVKR